MSYPIILFDGVCNLCNAIVNFLIKNDKTGRLRFAPLQSAAGKQLLQQYGLPPQGTDSVVLIEKDKAYLKSTVALKLVPYIGWQWQWMKAFWIVPKPLRDVVYDFISKNRTKWFGKRDGCMVPTPALKQRFLEGSEVCE